MNILEFKLHLEDAFKEVEDEKYIIEEREMVGFIENIKNYKEEVPEIPDERNLVFESIKGGKLPSGDGFVLIELVKGPEQHTSWKDMEKSLSGTMDKIALNVPIIFIFEDRYIFLHSLTSILAEGEQEGGKKVTFAKLMVQFVDHEHENYDGMYLEMMAEFGIPFEKG